LYILNNRIWRTSRHPWRRDWPRSEQPRVCGPQQAGDGW